MKPKAKRPFYGNQHVTPDQLVERARVAQLKALTGPTNKELRKHNKEVGDTYGMRREEDEEEEEQAGEEVSALPDIVSGHSQ